MDNGENDLAQNDLHLKRAFKNAAGVVIAILVLSYLVSLFNGSPASKPTETVILTDITSPSPLPASTTVTPTSDSTETSIPKLSASPASDPTKTSIPEPSASPTSDPTETSISAFPVNVEPVSSPFPTPEKGEKKINLPDRFRVGPWHDDYIRCDNDPTHYTVRIYGVEIFHGNDPYQFTFWQFDNEYNPFIKPITLLKEFKEYVEFEEPVIVSKGTYIHVTLTFKSEGVESMWVDDLYYHYLNDPNCH